MLKENVKYKNSENENLWLEKIEFANLEYR